MMEDIVLNISIAVMIVSVLYAAYYAVRNGFGYTRRKDGSIVTSYTLHFKGDSIPDISQNNRLRDKLTIQRTLPDGYLVESTINDSNIAAILKEDYGITAKEVLIQSTKHALQS